MTADQPLAGAIGTLIERKLSAGMGFVRVPEISSPFPVDELLRKFEDFASTRFAVFLHNSGLMECPRVTTEVHTAILWRNDPNMTDGLVIIGDLERDRAAGLVNVPTITASDVRQ